MRKIIHVDMDCFYAAVEIRDNPALVDQPVAVGGPSQRGVVCTSNYMARQYGVRSAMSLGQARQLCKNLVVLPVNMTKYKQVAQRIHAIFRQYTTLVEPLSLDEAYLDVSNVKDFQGSATLIAKAIRQQIWQSEQLTASAGVAPNKFLAKIASGWKKPNGLFVIRPEEIAAFVKELKVDELFGVGKVTAEKLHQQNLKTCADLQPLSLAQLTEQFGKLGQRLYEQCRGIDERAVEANRIRKSLSVEQTFPKDRASAAECMVIINELFEKLIVRLQEHAADYQIKNQFIKIKCSDFKVTTAEAQSSQLDLQEFLKLFLNASAKITNSIRLIGIGVHFKNETAATVAIKPQLLLLNL